MKHESSGGRTKSRVQRSSLDCKQTSVSSRGLLELQNQQRLTGERMYSEEERGALISNGWVEEDGPGKGAKKCLQSGRETRAVYVTEVKGRERLKKQELVNRIGCR